jgi:hypothetical protein
MLGSAANRSPVRTQLHSLGQTHALILSHAFIRTPCATTPFAQSLSAPRSP